MVIYCVEVKVLPGKEAEFEKATLENRLETRKESGNLRFDVLQQNDDPTSFFLYEAYSNSDSVLAHKQTAHYLKWRDLVAPWMAEPRKGTSHKVCAPLEVSKW
ncbi:antibiotic biosynthesis monooxygenase [Oceanispirochaeta crateris]|uniref:Antibiotic biosynthesis monooxygenase n=1 Tax=Oceanispirochaeta crateris TaxID=2518645 RepID=A0A5C1QLX9_9SPIO|nr:antibiotic biosynthesis monooxygenase [Oceanispirochaeta crateris]QEN09115.1 antibiotic biosynthesis monooxygenase [Oceanispirochaeta crateris]